MYPRATLAALAVSTLFVSTNAAFAQQDEGMVVVTATRFAETDPRVPSNVLVLTRKDISRSPALNIPDLLATIPGMDVRPLYGNQGADSKIDLRGFGENGHLRTLILVDGRRVEQLDFSSPTWSAIPLDSIERIEVMSGSNSVLYGDQAVGGVVNIITRSPQKDAGSLEVQVGSFNHREVKVSASRKDIAGTGIGFVGDFMSQASDEYRDNNETLNQAFNGRASLPTENGDYYLDFGIARSRYGLPGSLTQAQFDTAPTAAESTDSNVDRVSWRVRPGVAMRFGPNLDIRAEVSHEQSQSESWISNWPSFVKIDSSHTAFTPRLRWKHGLADLSSTTTAGVDIGQSRLDQDKASSPTSAITGMVQLRRDSAAVYAQNVTQLFDVLSVQAGARQQAVDETLQRSSIRVENRQTEKAWELGTAWQASDQLKLFAKASSTFRFPVLDEYTTTNGLAAPLPRPETGRGLDGGVELRGSRWQIKATAYDLNMEDEITWNNSSGQNENMQRTSHRGIDISVGIRPTKLIAMNAGLTRRSSTFRDGPDQGKSIPLVADTTGSFAVSVDSGVSGQHSLAVRHLGKRPYGGDTANTRPKLPSVTTLDWQSALRLGDWTWSVKVNNLTDRKYATAAFDYGFGSSYYVANPRTAYLSGKFEF